MRNGEANKKNRSKKKRSRKRGKEKDLGRETQRRKKVNEGEKREMKDFLLPRRKRNNGG